MIKHSVISNATESLEGSTFVRQSMHVIIDMLSHALFKRFPLRLFFHLH